MNEERVKRLQDRFELIRKALAMQHGENFALAVAFGAWLMAIETAIKDDFEDLADNRVLDQSEMAARKVKQVHDNLISFHKYVCERLEVNQGKVIDLLPSFKEVLTDIMKGKG